MISLRFNITYSCDSLCILVQPLNSLLPGLILILISQLHLLNPRHTHYRWHYFLLFLWMLSVHLLLIAEVLLHHPCVLIDFGVHFTFFSIAEDFRLSNNHRHVLTRRILPLNYIKLVIYCLFLRRCLLNSWFLLNYQLPLYLLSDSSRSSLKSDLHNRSLV